MSVNTAHANNGVLIHAGEWILLFSENVNIEFAGQDDALFKGSKNGRIYLTTHRIIFNNKHKSDLLQSFSMPFIAMNDIDIEQPMMGSNYIKGKVRAQPNGNWNGESKFKIYFKSGGAIDFGQAMKRAAIMAQRYMRSDAPPPYTPPAGSWYEAPPPAYQAPQGYYGWIPSGDGISNNPPPNTVFMSDNPPPYPGISGQPGQPGPTPNGYPGYPGSNPSTGGYPGSAPPPFGYPGANQPGYPPGAPQAGYPNAAQAGYPAAPQPGYPGAPQPGYPGAPQPGYPGGPSGYPGYPGPGQPMGYPGNPAQATGYPGSAPPNMGYPGGPSGPSVGHMGFTSGPSQNSKEAEAAQSSYYDPSRPQTAYVPPPSYYEPPPSYDSVSKKTQ